MAEETALRGLKASVIILSWNGMKYLEDCLNAVLAQDYPDFEVIVVDNGSTDASPDFVSAHYPQVRLIRNKYNLGFAAGNNVGLKAAMGDVLILLNQDTIVRPGWMKALVGTLKKETVGIAGCKILYPDGRTIQHAGGWIEWPLGLTFHYGQGEQDMGQWDTPRQVDYVTAAAMAFRRDVLERVGFLDEEFWPGYFEDTDFCLRARKMGYEVWYTPDAVLTHVESASHTDQVFMWQAHHRGRMRLVLKHLPPDQFLSQFVQAEELHQPEVIGVFGSRPLCRAYMDAILEAPPILRHYWQADSVTIKEVIRGLQHLHSRAWDKDWRRTRELIETAVTVPPHIDWSSQDTLMQEEKGTFSPMQSKRETSLPEALAIPRLQEFEFHSDVPLIGPLISRIRALWYGIAAKWGLRHLMHQQEEINKYYARWLKEHIERQAVINQNHQKALDQQWERFIYHVQRQEAIGQRYQRYIEALERRLAELADENALLAQEIARLILRLHEAGNKDE